MGKRRKERVSLGKDQRREASERMRRMRTITLEEWKEGFEKQLV